MDTQWAIIADNPMNEMTHFVTKPEKKQLLVFPNLINPKMLGRSNENYFDDPEIIGIPNKFII